MPPKALLYIMVVFSVAVPVMFWGVAIAARSWAAVPGAVMGTFFSGRMYLLSVRALRGIKNIDDITKKMGK